jgi:hypothetical protein
LEDFVLVEAIGLHPFLGEGNNPHISVERQPARSFLAAFAAGVILIEEKLDVTALGHGSKNQFFLCG